MSGRTTLIVLGICVVSVVLSATAEEKPAGAAQQLAKLEWMRGEWVREQGADRLEEIWSAPSGDSLMGMFRWDKQGKAWMYELMCITVEEGTLVFRLKHFDRRLAGWEPKDPPTAYRLQRQAEREVVFENAERSDPRRFVYSIDDEGRFVVRLESERDGETRATEFRFRRR